MKGLALIALGLALAGCARDDGEADLPEACGSDAAVFADALRTAPSPVRVDEVPVSDCLARNASAGDVQAVGATFLATAQQLGEDRDAVALGYLVGALRSGAKESQGIHLELVRRVEQEARPFAGSAAFERGLRAGRTSG